MSALSISDIFTYIDALGIKGEDRLEWFNHIHKMDIEWVKLTIDGHSKTQNHN